MTVDVAAAAGFAAVAAVAVDSVGDADAAIVVDAVDAAPIDGDAGGIENASSLPKTIPSKLRWSNSRTVTWDLSPACTGSTPPRPQWPS